MASRTAVERSTSALKAISSYRYINFSDRATARKMIDFSKLSSSQLYEFRNRYDAYIFDVDGCLVTLRNGPIDGVNEALCEIARNGKTLMVLTDNCLHTLNAISAKVNGLFPAISKECVMNSGYLLVKYLKEINFNKKIYAVGSEHGVITELKENGFDVLHDEELRKMTVPELIKVKFEGGVGAVSIAGDTNFNYFKIFKAVNYLADPEVLLLQTHLPILVHMKPILLGAGAIAACVKAASGRTETIGVGKGSEYSCKYLKSIGFEVQRCLFVGDELSTDIVSGNMSGMDTLFVLTGNCNLKTVESAKEKKLVNRIPTYYTNSVADLIKAFKT